jgi:phosphoesterase RecJ-like protein
LERLTLNKKYDIAYTIILQKDFQDFPGCSLEDVEGLSNFLNNLSDVAVTAVIREDGDNKVKFSFRTTRSDRDVGALAAYFGGGGHRKAAGFTISGRLDFDEQSRRWRII